MHQFKYSSATKIFITPDNTILEAMSRIDEGALHIAIAIDENQKLIGILTDGDIRRAILRRVSLNAPVGAILNRSPLICHRNEGMPRIEEILQADPSVLRIPVVDEEDCVVGVFLVEDTVTSAIPAVPVVVMAGGLGERMRPHTETTPKPLLEVAGKPILQRTIESLSSQGFQEFIISIRYLGDKIIDYFGDGSKFDVQIKYIREEDRMGTAGALRMMSAQLDRPFAVINGDIITKADLRNLSHYHRDTNAVATMCVKEFEFQVPYGVVVQEDGRLIDLHEKPVLKHLVNAGIYMFDPIALKSIPDRGYFDMTTFFETLQKNHPESTNIFPLREYWRDIGNPNDLERVSKEVLTEEMA
ncbi:nucleotidyltransferase family protein [Roseibium sp. FZY0029]|uniref:nucleotidyltransferase family protein n=1 Tax=Roseibium sp. FZY0029 TaxID=3116647 RepID=UPI002ECB1A28|nr:nucleotidyltransferase family protein [Roseibium sp. FZY0029]